jgi:hypothetical protein
MEQMPIAKYIGDQFGIQLWNLLTPLRDKRTMQIHPVNSTVDRKRIETNYPQVKFPDQPKIGDLAYIHF